MHITVEHISDITDPRLDPYARLTEAQLRNKLHPEEGIFIAETYKVIRTAISEGYIIRSLVVPASRSEQVDRYQELLSSKKNDGVPLTILVVDDHALTQVAGYVVTRGELAVFKRPAPLDMNTVLTQTQSLCVVDGIVDSTNLGALFRSAAALGVGALLLSPTCCDALLRRVVRVSMGTALQIPWVRFEGSEKDWRSFGLKTLSKAGFTTVALALTNDAYALDGVDFLADKKLALTFGTEGYGLGSDVIDQADYVVQIPMQNGVDSLNVAASSAVVFWELIARRKR